MACGLDYNNLHTRTNHEKQTEEIIGCSVFHHGTKSYGIVSGGSLGLDSTNRYLDSTEIIDFDQESPKWTEGMQDKSKIVYL